MCDTFVAVDAAGGVLFAKNSDRDPGEPQLVRFHPPAEHPAGSRVRCTYIEVPQVRETLAVWLAQPAWIWGAEMGVNAAGVAIGNEAIFTQRKPPKRGLLGMDLLRLALERARTAAEAVELLVAFSHDHGQGGVASAFNGWFRYWNSFLVADPTEAWVLEFADARTWAAVRVTAGVRAISNRLTIVHDWDLASPKLERRVGRRGFAATFNDPLMTRIAAGTPRWCRVTELATRLVGAATPAAAAAVLRDHGGAPETAGRWRLPAGAPCMHARSLLHPSQTTCSMIVQATGPEPRVWTTGASAPCLVPFKPLSWSNPKVPTARPSPLHYDPETYWWRREWWHRWTLGDWSERVPRLVAVRDEIEQELGPSWQAVQSTEPVPDPGTCFAHESAALARLADELAPRLQGIEGPWWYRSFWRSWLKKGQLPPTPP